MSLEAQLRSEKFALAKLDLQLGALGDLSTRREHSEVFEAQVQLAASPRVGGGVTDLLFRQVRRGPVRCLRAFGNPEAEKKPGQVAHARLLEAVALRDLSEIENRSRIERKQELQLPEVVPDADARLDDG